MQILKLMQEEMRQKMKMGVHQEIKGQKREMSQNVFLNRRSQIRLLLPLFSSFYESSLNFEKLGF